MLDIGLSLTIGHEKLEVKFPEPKITPGVSRMQGKVRREYKKRVNSCKKVTLVAPLQNSDNRTRQPEEVIQDPDRQISGTNRATKVPLTKKCPTSSPVTPLLATDTPATQPKEARPATDSACQCVQIHHAEEYCKHIHTGETNHDANRQEQEDNAKFL